MPLTPADQPRIFSNIVESLEGAACSLSDARRRTREAIDAFEAARDEADAGSDTWHQADKAYNEAVAVGLLIAEAVTAVYKARPLARQSSK